jgi:hypothetical protein
VSDALQAARACSAATAAGCAFTAGTWAITIGNASSPYDLGEAERGDGVLKLNVNGTGYYRVNYPLNLWQALFVQAAVDAVRGGSGEMRILSPGDVGGLVDDLFAITDGAFSYNLAAGIDTAFALQQASELSSVDFSYEAVTPLLQHLLAVFGRLVPDVPLAQAGNSTASPVAAPADLECVSQFSAFAGDSLLSVTLAGVIAQTYGSFTDDYFVPPNSSTDPLQLQLYIAALDAASAFNQPGVVAEARALYDAGWRDAPVDFQAVVLNSGQSAL